MIRHTQRPQRTRTLAPTPTPTPIHHRSRTAPKLLGCPPSASANLPTRPPTPLLAARSHVLRARMSPLHLAACTNTRDNTPGAHSCSSQVGSGTCARYLGPSYKDCDRTCGLCACSTASGTTREHCSGNGICKADCTRKGSCTGARCVCNAGFGGSKCERKQTTCEPPPHTRTSTSTQHVPSTHLPSQPLMPQPPPHTWNPARARMRVRARTPAPGLCAHTRACNRPRTTRARICSPRLQLLFAQARRQARTRTPPVSTSTLLPPPPHTCYAGGVHEHPRRVRGVHQEGR